MNSPSDVNPPIVFKTFDHHMMEMLQLAMHCGIEFDTVPVKMGDTFGTMIYFNRPQDAVWFKLKMEHAD
jgi:hypothetical protein